MTDSRTCAGQVGKPGAQTPRSTLRADGLKDRGARPTCTQGARLRAWSELGSAAKLFGNAINGRLVRAFNQPHHPLSQLAFERCKECFPCVDFTNRRQCGERSSIDRWSDAAVETSSLDQLEKSSPYASLTFCQPDSCQSRYEGVASG